MSDGPEMASVWLDEAVSRAAREAETFRGFLANALHRLMTPPVTDRGALEAAVPGPDWAGLAAARHPYDEEDHPEECWFTEWAEEAGQFERYVLDAAILIYSFPVNQGMTSGSLELRTFVAPDARGYLYWVGDAELTNGEMWFGYTEGDREALVRELSELLPEYAGFGGAVVLPEFPEVEALARKIAEEQAATPWDHEGFQGVDPDELHDWVGEEVAVAAGVDHEAVRQAIGELVRGNAPDPVLAWAIVRAFNGPQPHRVEDLYSGKRFSLTEWPAVC